MNAEKYWLFNTEEYLNPASRKPKYANPIWRKKSGAIAWIDWNNENKTAELLKLERLPNYSKGEGANLLHFILSICREFNFSLHGNVIAYDPHGDTESTPEANKSLAEWYLRNGCLAHQDASGIWHINFKPE